MLYSFTSLNNALLIEIQLLKSDARARWPWSWKWKTSYWRARARSPLTPSRRRHWRAARGWPTGAANLAAWLSDAPARTRRWAADAPAPASLVAVRCAATHPYWCARAAACPPRPLCSYSSLTPVPRPRLLHLYLPPCVAVAQRTIPRTRSSARPLHPPHSNRGQTRATHRRAKCRLFCPARRACIRAASRCS